MVLIKRINLIHSLKTLHFIRSQNFISLYFTPLLHSTHHTRFPQSISVPCVFSRLLSQQTNAGRLSHKPVPMLSDALGRRQSGFKVQQLRQTGSLGFENGAFII